MEFHIDEEKVKARGIYTPKEVLDFIDAAFLWCELSKGEDGCYYGEGNGKDLARFGEIVETLSASDWFMDYADKWLWYSDDESEASDSFSVEDVLAFYRGEPVGNGETVKYRRAVSYDLNHAKLIKYYHGRGKRRAQREIEEFLTAEGFTRRENSDYISERELYNIELVDIIQRMKKKLPWLMKCLESFYAVNVLETYSIFEFLDKYGKKTEDAEEE